jgi:acetyl-CoA C-acetyltransferase
MAAQRAYKRAGIDDPGKQIDVAEICEPYAFQELLWYEALGFCQEGEGGRLIDNGSTESTGDLPVNPSGGVLSSNSYISRGLIRLVEVTLQLRGQAGEIQLDRKLTRGLAHGTQGFAGQFHSVVIAEI